MAARTAFSTVRGSGLEIASSWRGERSVDSSATQTAASLFETSESEVQSGLRTEVEQLQVPASLSGLTLLAFLERRGRSRVDWSAAVEQGRVTVDCEVTTAPDRLLEQDFFVELVDCRRDAATQTAASSGPEEDSKTDDRPGEEEALAGFLRRVAPVVERELDLNLASKAFAGVDLSSGDAGGDTKLWGCLSVDLERRRVVLPDWSGGRHMPGNITRCLLTRTRERVYDVEFEDGGKLFAVREEHIRVREARTRRSGPQVTLAAEMRVHVKVGNRYVPGRIRRVGPSNTFDVDCEGGRFQQGLPLEDLLCGLEEGMAVEVRRPRKTHLQSTCAAWSCTGSSLAVSFGRRSLEGWSEVPGAVCVWAVFGRT